MSSDRRGTPPESHVGERIRSLRQRTGMSHAGVARSMNTRGHENWHPQTLVKVENRSRKLTFAEAVSLCRILGISLNDLAVAEESLSQEALAAAALCNDIEQQTEHLIRVRLRISGAVGQLAELVSNRTLPAAVRRRATDLIEQAGR